jgi:hypothetical protein
MMRAVLIGAAGAAGVVLIALASCGGAPPTPAAPGGSKDPGHWPSDDGSLCERFVHWKNSAELEASITAGPGSFRPNIRRIFKTVGDRDNRHSVLLCREIDTNLDGLKDVVRTFNEKGEPLHEEADRNFDGKIDVWLNFADGRIQEEDVDTTYSTARPNVWKFYLDGQLSRVRRNTHCASGAPDTWEIYYKDKLERVGSDSTCDGHVDRWDRDAQLLAAEEAAQEKAQTASNAKAAPSPSNEAANGAVAGSTPVTVGPSGEMGDAGAPSGPKPKKKRRP